MRQNQPKLFYRVLLNGADWYWEIISEDREVLDRGLATDEASARAGAISAAFTKQGALAEPSPV